MASLALLAAGATAPVASAHAVPVLVSPRPGGQVSGNPPFAEINFNSRVLGAEEIHIKDSSGRPVSTGPVENLDNGTRIRTRVPALPSGDYVVSWQAQSADGHLSAGRFMFSVGVGSSTSATVGSSGWLDGGVRWLMVMTLLVPFGVVVTGRLAWSGITAGDTERPLLLPLPRLLAATVAASLLSLALVVARTIPDQATLANAVAAAGTSRAVEFAGGGLLLAAVALVLGMRRRVGWAAVALGLALVGAAASGHPAETGRAFAVPANAVHLLTVGVWTGGLAQLVYAGYRLRGRDDRRALLDGARRYSAVALWSVLAAILTGAVTALAEFSSPAQLVDSGYGRVLLVKMTLVAVTLVLALAARQGGIGIRRPRPNLLVRVTRSEGGLLALVVAAAALLANTAPPAPATAADPVLPPPRLTGPVLQLADFDGRYNVRLQAAGDTVVATLMGAPGEDLSRTRMEIFTVTPEFDDINVFPRSCGSGCATGDYPFQDGRTAFLVATRGPAGESVSTFSVVWPPPASDPAQLQRLVAWLSAQPALDYTETMTTSQGTSAEAHHTGAGGELVTLTGLRAPGVRLLPYRTEPNELLLEDAANNRQLILQLAPDGRLLHELEVTPAGRLERRFN
jgi:copper transport protein